MDKTYYSTLHLDIHCKSKQRNSAFIAVLYFTVTVGSYLSINEFLPHSTGTSLLTSSFMEVINRIYCRYRERSVAIPFIDLTPPQFCVWPKQ